MMACNRIEMMYWMLMAEGRWLVRRSEVALKGCNVLNMLFLFSLVRASEFNPRICMFASILKRMNAEDQRNDSNSALIGCGEDEK
jgi:hypothetical protein